MNTPVSFRTVLATAVTAFPGVTASVQAQGTCADLNILSVTYAAFNNTSIEVIAHTNPGTFFSYPSFSLLSEQGNTITHEEINFFGIGENVQTHSSPVVGGQSLPPTPFTGDLVFMHYGMDDIDTCVYPFSGSLCPLTFCEPLDVFIYSMGPVVDASFAWTMTDGDGQLVGGGDLTIAASGQQTDQDPMCLHPGAYTLHMDQTSGPAGTFQYGVTRNMFISVSPGSVFFQGQENHLPFLFFEPCFEGTNAIEEVAADDVDVLVTDRRITISRRDGRSLGAIEVLDAGGRMAFQLRTSSAQTAIDLAQLSTGIYLVRVGGTPSNATGSFVQRIILN